MTNYKQKLNELKIKYNIIFPQIDDKSVHFTLKGVPIRYMYYFSNGSWGLILGKETDESKAFMESLLKEGFFTLEGKANYKY